MTKFNDIFVEAKRLIELALPIILSLSLSCSMSVIDTVMAGQVSAQDLAAVSIGAAGWNLLFLTMTAVIMALTPQLAKLFGERNYSAILDWVCGGRWFALLVTSVFYAASVVTLYAISRLDTAPGTIDLASNYLLFILLGLPAAALLQVHKSLSESSGNTKHILLVTGIGVLLNIPLNYLFIHGLSLDNQTVLIPAMGGAGCGMASGIIFWLTLIGLIQIQKKDKQLTHKIFNTDDSNDCKHRNNFSWTVPKEFKTIASQLAKVGIPIGLAIFAEVSVFTYIPLVIAHLGKIQVASHQIALNVSSMMFMIPLGMSQAITVRTGYHLGRGSPQMAQMVSRTGIAIAFLFGIASMSLIMLNSNSIPKLYTDNEEVLLLASSLLILAAIFQLSDTVQVTAAGALRGYQLTTIPMILTLVSFWVIAIPVGYILGLESDVRSYLETIIYLPDPMGAKGFWVALISGLSANGLLQTAYLFYIQTRRYPATHQGSFSPL